MAAICSDTFNGMAADAVVEGRTLDNGLGGSGSRTWERASGIGSTFEADGSNALRQAFSAGEFQGVSLGSNTNGKARFKFTTTDLAVYFCLFGKSDVAKPGGTNSISALLLCNGTTNALRLRNQADTDLAQQTISALSTSTTYYLELEINGNAVVGRILNNDLSVRDTVSHTYSSGAPTGNYWGFGSYDTSNTSWRADDWYMDDLVGGGGAFIRPGNRSKFLRPAFLGRH
jgi:hypothetical protein